MPPPGLEHRTVQHVTSRDAMYTIPDRLSKCPNLGQIYEPQRVGDELILVLWRLNGLLKARKQKNKHSSMRVLPNGCRTSQRHTCWKHTSTASFTVLIASPSFLCIHFCCYLFRCTHTALKDTYPLTLQEDHDTSFSAADLYRDEKITEL